MRLTNIDMQVGVAILGKQLFCQYNIGKFADASINIQERTARLWHCCSLA